MQVVTQDEVRQRDKQDFPGDDGLNQVTHYFGGPGENNDEPSAFLVEFRPTAGGVIRPHFHKIAQFQVVIGGGGKIGKVPVPAVSFQYADPSTPYGPITPADEERGIDFLTLRPVTRGGIWWMPGSRSEMSGRAGRNRAASVSPDAPLPSVGSEVEEMIKPDDDGLAGYLVRLAPHADGVVDAPAQSRGQYQMVTRGTIIHEGRELERLALMFVEPGERIAFTAGADGGEVLVMQFPATIEPNGAG
jgi:hypothetical protein